MKTIMSAKKRREDTDVSDHVARTVRERISRLLLEQGKSAKQVSSEAGLGSTYLTDFLSARHGRPSVTGLYRISKVLSTTVAYLVGEVEDAASTALGSSQSGVEDMPIIGIVETGAYRAPDREQGAAAPHRTRVARSADYPEARHFALAVRDRAMDRKSGEGNGALALCIDMLDAGLAVEHGRIYAIKRTVDGGKTYETLVRRALIHRERVDLVPESTQQFAVISIPGRLSVDPLESVYAFGLVYAFQNPTL